MIAIQTKFLGATNCKPSRIKAFTHMGANVTVSWDHGLNADENYLSVANKLAAKMGWVGKGYGKLVGGGMKDGDVFVFVKDI
jgi:hypothetical protein